ncbi:protein-glutamate O-methyltransferase CheR [Magnetospirillum sp. UT-4]|uniref:CheR family methyltransferase n=1 Tax=Magnetospirillum sp. UT-4 TaxID=2681467 RepID=UPI00138541D3|nr:protein-glutamate O-methyltransferase [Magnetospirillum sp. UT-4]CAA7625227.1 chemotaxis regulator, protein-glutamate methyltransferase [Magnetospirillum sp. UT-4]
MAHSTAEDNGFGHRREFELGDDEFRFLAAFMSRETGIVLSEHKREMVCGRLVKRLRALKLRDFADYCDILKGPGAAGEVEHLVNAITTNITNFFREPHHFEHLRREVLTPRLAERPRRPRVRIWSAGCSTGEEPYSIAMVMADVLKAGEGWDSLVLATDIDTNVLQRAEAGLYPAEAAAKIPETYRKRFVRRVPGDGDRMQMADDIRRLIRFRRLNLHEKWPMKGSFDAIFCRNVAIYFDKPTQRKLFNRYADALAMGGVLYLGHAESLIGVSDRFEVSDKTAYRRIA